MTNEEINNISITEARGKKKKFYYKRTGICEPSKCSSACCRFVLAGMHYEGYHKIVFEWSKNPIGTFNPRNRKEVQLVFSFHCPQITIDGKCKLHNKKDQPYICDAFPMVPSDTVYKYVNKYCGYKFVKTKIEENDNKVAQ